MNLLDLSEQSFGVRVLAALTVMVILAGVAAGAVVFAMMMILFSVDGPSRRLDEAMLTRSIWMVSLSLSVAIFAPPLLLLCKASPPVSLLPAGVGFVAAGLTTLWLVVQNLEPDHGPGISSTSGSLAWRR